ncbi:hypothetical protein BGZ57DRAFT_858502 [Hyaloscypha finlandica]|nr:hypothetical protein BGZ57DRAFT_858502 [Hyaloscypha finlandica]
MSRRKGSKWDLGLKWTNSGTSLRYGPMAERGSLNLSQGQPCPDTVSAAHIQGQGPGAHPRARSLAPSPPPELLSSSVLRPPTPRGHDPGQSRRQRSSHLSPSPSPTPIPTPSPSSPPPPSYTRPPRETSLVCEANTATASATATDRQPNNRRLPLHPPHLTSPHIFTLSGCPRHRRSLLQHHRSSPPPASRIENRPAGSERQ